MQKNSVKWSFARELNTHHHHSSHPEKKYIMPCFQHLRGIKCTKVWVLQIWPAQRAEGPKPAAEPSVQDIRLLHEVNIVTMRAACLLVRLLLISGHHIGSSTVGCSRACICHLCCAVHIPDRNSMPPPKLSRDAPVFDTSQPIEVNLLEPFWDDADLSRLHHIQRWLCKLLHPYKPLLAHHGLNHFTTPLRTRYTISVLLSAHG
mmetsp:Transcript_5212/g.32739  ORF Transcript_5212/g.32739 Transcript_5212/m.32739 type:complete len:204 (+) Transcript_5212:1847-2458(+)